MQVLRSVKGMHDVMPADMPRWHFIERTYREVLARYGYQEIRTPILEPIELFVRGIGETTDIVEKEMYSFVDKGGDHLALRPEGTASAVRAYVQNSVQADEPQSKWYYVGPMFRRERPGKGRYRQFYQAGAELLGVTAPAADAELIDMAVQFVAALGIAGVVVKINTLGSNSSRPKFREALVHYFSDYVPRLCPDCQRRLTTNPLRIIDCKVPGCQEVAAGAPSVLEHIADDDAAHFAEVRRLLDQFGTPYEVVPTMVRGLDYYTRTIFEVQVKSGGLGSQDSIFGGGRYDNLVEQLGGRPTPAIGFAFGLERLNMVMPAGAEGLPLPVVYVAGVGPSSLSRAFDVARALRNENLRVEVAYSEASLRNQLKKADRFAAAKVVICGEDEAARGAVTLRDMRDGTQTEIQLAELPSILRDALC